MSLLTDLKKNSVDLAVNLVGMRQGIACLEDAHKRLQDALKKAFPVKDSL
jgi:hypothetical protein